MDYKHDESNQISLEYSRHLRQEVPRLFSGDFIVVTEMGRAVVATSGWFVSRIEYTKIASGRLIGITHAGGNMFVREVYMGNTWFHPITVYDGSGCRKTADVKCVILQVLCVFQEILLLKDLIYLRSNRETTLFITIQLHTRLECIQCTTQLQHLLCICTLLQRKQTR